MPEETVAQERIAVALIGLLNEKPLDRISITEITEKAGVSRVSYYRHFSSKEDVLTQHAEYVLESVYVDMKSGKLCNAYDFWKRIYHDLGESCLVSSMQKADLQNSFFRSFEIVAYRLHDSSAGSTRFFSQCFVYQRVLYLPQPVISRYK